MAEDLASFFQAVLQLKSVKRAGWASKVGISNPESVAEHTFSMCALGMVLSDMTGMDTRKVMKMILLHDLAESIVGDYMPGEISSSQKNAKEDRAMKKILSCLPSELRSEYDRIWKEYQQDRTEVARFVHRIDKLEMAFQADRYEKDGHPTKSLEQFFESAHKAVDVKDDIVKEILKSLRPKPKA